MSNPDTALRWLITAACCWPAPVPILLTLLIVNAFQRGWLHIQIDRTKAPKLNWRRNAR
jgi:hypothetical protein